MNPISALAMSEELSKSAALPRMLQRLISRGIIGGVLRTGGLTRSLGGAAIGGIAGGIAGGGEGTPEEVAARRRSGILKGALIGAAGGYAAPLITSEGRKRALEGTKNFFARERHGLFGGRAPSTMDPQAALEGRTSIPGVLKGMVTKPGELIRKGWHEGGRWGKLMTVGTGVMGAHDVIDPNVPGGKAEKAGRLLGETGGYLVGSRLPFLSSMLFATGTGAAGKYLGRAVDKITGSGQPIAAPPEQAQAVL